MLVILGFLVVLFSVFGGFAMQGGHLAALFQPLELLMIGGAALGTFFVGNDAKAIRATFAA
ncbi:MAG: motility-associated protein, partial [Janthinobacterium sp.]